MASRPLDGCTLVRLAIIESPYGTRVDGTRCSPEEVARNVRYLNRCIRDSLARGEAPYASHGFFTAEGRLDDNVPEQRRQGIDAGLEWANVAALTLDSLAAVYADHGITSGMTDGVVRHDENGIDIEYRYIGKEPDIALQ